VSEALRASGVWLNVAGFDLLRAIDMSLAPGSVTAIVGPNGAGKTSLTRVLTGDVPATKGRVFLNGRPLSGWSPRQRAQMLAVLPQESSLDFPFTAREVVTLGRLPHQSGRLRDAAIVREALELVDVAYLYQRAYTTMSGGERQRVQLARVLAQIWEPAPQGERVLVLDEPTSALDLAHQRLTLDIMRHLGQQGVAVLLVAHDLNLAARCADQLIVLDRGSVVARGTPREVLEPALLESTFGVKCVVTEHPLDHTPMVIH
jgi:iron complex transport system ATP-binding protein